LADSGASLTSRSAIRVGVDIGGTFTDLCIESGGEVVGVAKTLTTAAEPARGVVEVLSRALAALSAGPEAISHVIHGTTLVTNALLERKGERTALLMTAGFRDVLELGRERRADLYDLMVEQPRPLVPRHLRFDVPERTRADGRVLEPVDLDLVQTLANELIEHGVSAVAVCFLHSFKNPSNEQAARAAISIAAPSLRVAISSEVVPEIREYDRASTTVISVYVQSIVERYLADLALRLQQLGVAAELRIMLSDGGLAQPTVAAANPIRMLESGPAAGALAAAAYGRVSDRTELLSFDMGGTSAKLCVVEGGDPLVAHDFEVDRVYRLRKGSGLPVKTPVIDMIEIGVGGGSIARITPLGLLAVGPESAGAMPGPACYGQGGTEPTVTDADLVLGYLDPDFFLGGEMKLDVDAARAALKTRIAESLGADIEQAAWAIHRQVNDDMASAARVHASERGHNPSSLPLFAFGGAGPVHAAGVAAAMGADEIVIAPSAGVMSAVGMLTAPIAFEFVRSYPDRVDDGLLERARPLLLEMESDGAALLLGSGVKEHEISHQRSADMRFVGQGYEVRVPLPDDGISLSDSFYRAYQRKYGRAGPQLPLEVLSWRVSSRGPRPELGLGGATGAYTHTSTSARPSSARPISDRSDAARKGARLAWTSSGGLESVDVYDRYGLRPGTSLEGPAIVEERESTAVVPTGALCRVGQDLSLTISLRGSGR
jgi:N-methylhydantoinase A